MRAWIEAAPPSRGCSRRNSSKNPGSQLSPEQCGRAGRLDDTFCCVTARDVWLSACCCSPCSITIPEIRQHAWYSKPLPPPYSVALADLYREQCKIDEQVRGLLGLGSLWELLLSTAGWGGLYTCVRVAGHKHAPEPPPLSALKNGDNHTTS